MTLLLELALVRFDAMAPNARLIVRACGERDGWGELLHITNHDDRTTTIMLGRAPLIALAMFGLDLSKDHR